jgi:dTDP-4-dehydrorhamnose 3,5-epimerase-like enzyme
VTDRLRRAEAEGWSLVALPQIPEPRGNLTVLEECVHPPFPIGSVRWFYDVPAGTSWRAGESRLGDALIVALSGSFEVVLGRRRSRSAVRLSRANTGLQVPAGLDWTVHDASTNSVGLVISSQENRLPSAGPGPLDQSEPAALNPESTIDDCRTITLPHRRDEHGSATEAVPREGVPFDIPRVYYLYDVPGGARRGGHAHRDLEQIVLAVAGAFDLLLDDGRRARSIRLDRAHSGVLIATGIWRELLNFSSGAICLVLASAPYDEADYVRDYDAFQREKLRL